PFGFEAPDAIVQDMVQHLPVTQGYSDSRGILSARRAVVQYYETRGIHNLGTDEVFLGNGVSELITLSLQALCNPGDESLVPGRADPLRADSLALAGGSPVHYRCAEEDARQPDLAGLESRLTGRTRGIVVSNPHNPTGAVYSQETLKQIADIARRHGLIVFADEIYEKITYNGVELTNLATLTGDDVLCLTFSGLSK